MARTYTPDEIWHLIVRYRWVILVPVALGIAAVPLLAQFAKPRYRSEAAILVVPPQVPDNYVPSTVVEKVEDRLPGITAIILSRSRLERIILEMDLYKAERETTVMEDVVQTMRTRDIRTSGTGRDVNSFAVSYIGDDPETARKVTERLASLYIDQNTRDRFNQSESTTQVLENQIEATKVRLTEKEKLIAAYRMKHAGQLPSQMQSNLAAQQNAQMSLRQLMEATNRAEERKMLKERELASAKMLPTPVAAPTTGGPITLTTAQLLEAERIRLTALLQRLQPAHPDVKKSEDRIAELTAKLESETPLSPRVTEKPLTLAEATQQRRLAELETELEVIERTLKTNREEEANLRRQIASFQAKVDVVPTRESELIELTRDYDALNKTYSELLLKKEGASMASTMEQRQLGEQFKLLDEASLPHQPFNNTERLAIMSSGAVAGLLLALLVLGWREYRDSSFHSTDEVVKGISLPVLGAIPVMMSQSERDTAARRRLTVDIAGSAVLLASVAVVVAWQVL